jgi:hypothetical protein
MPGADIVSAAGRSGDAVVRGEVDDAAHFRFFMPGIVGRMT